MKNEEILRAMNAINDKYILEAEAYRHVHKVKLKSKLLEMAACICLILVVTIPVLNMNGDKYENDTASYTSQSMVEDVSDAETFSNSETSGAYDMDTNNIAVMGAGINESEDSGYVDSSMKASFAGSAENDMYSSDVEAVGSVYEESAADSIFIKSDMGSQLVEVYDDIFITENLKKELDSPENKNIIMATEIIFVDKETGNPLDIESSYPEVDRLFAEGYDIYIDAGDGYKKTMINITKSQLEDFSKNEKYEYWFGY